jgi:ribosome maturation factor RimP
MITAGQISEVAHQYLDGTDKFLVELFVRPVNKVFIYIDGDSGIKIEDCQALTRFIESKLDREVEDYDLTVSSSGADRPLKLQRQYPQHIGRLFAIKTTEGEQLTVKLIAADEKGIEIEHIPGKKEVKKPNSRLGYEKIMEAKIVLAFK